MPRTAHLHASSLQGVRQENEDVESYLLNLGNNGNAIDNRYCAIDFFVICDGHGGSAVAEIVAPMLKDNLTKPGLVYPLTHLYICKIFNFIQKQISETENKKSKKKESIGAECGCTALVLVRFYEKSKRKEYIQVINLGDCRAVLANSNGLHIPLTVDHKPFLIGERVRIDKINKTCDETEYAPIVFDQGDWRVNGLSVSRAFGDISAKPQVSHIPDSFVYDLSDTDKFIIMACDGLWDEIQNHYAVDFVSEHLHNNGDNLLKFEYNSYPNNAVKKTENIARKLASYAIAKGSGDNVSIFIIYFSNI